jgi:hypothetical protein
VPSFLITGYAVCAPEWILSSVGVETGSTPSLLPSPHVREAHSDDLLLQRFSTHPCKEPMLLQRVKPRAGYLHAKRRGPNKASVTVANSVLSTI